MTPEEYHGAVKAVAWQAGEFFPAERLVNVHSLIDHGEPAEGLCSLAWVIVTDRVLVPRTLIAAIRDYTGDLLEDESLPSDLESFVLPESVL